MRSWGARLIVMAMLSALAVAPASAGDLVLPVHSGGTVNSWFGYNVQEIDAWLHPEP
jgi:hypothetical protein